MLPYIETVFVSQNTLGATGNKFPYQMAVEELHKVVTLYCPLEKLECLGMNRFYLLFYCLRWCLKRVCILIFRCARASERSQSREENCVSALSRASYSCSRRDPARQATFYLFCLSGQIMKSNVYFTSLSSVRTSRCICQCVEDYWETKGKPRHSPETAM